MNYRFLQKTMAAILTISLFSQNAMAGVNLPDIGKLASEAASGLADAADQAEDILSDVAQQAGEAVSGVAEQAGDTLSGLAQRADNVVSDAVRQAEEAISEAEGQMEWPASVSGAITDDLKACVEKQIEDLVSGFVSKAGAVASKWGEQAGETADKIKKELSDAGISLQTTASELDSAVAEKVSALIEKAEKAKETAAAAVNAVTDAGNLVIDQAGHVVDMAAAGAGYVTSAAEEALQILQEKGGLLMETAQNAVAGIDLLDERNWGTAKYIVDDAINAIYKEGILTDKTLDQKTIQIISDVVFGAMIYTSRFADGQMTLGDYAGAMSETIIQEGLPAGVGLTVDLLCKAFNIPFDGDIARDVTYFLISVAYGDKSGEEIEAEEEALVEQILEGSEEITEGVTE